MKTTRVATAAAAVSLMCLFLFFHSCHGIKCYTCTTSKRYPDDRCEEITGDTYLVDYGSRADECVKLIYSHQDEKEYYRTTRRYGQPSKIGYNDTHPEVLFITKFPGFKVYDIKCNEDRCNNW